MRKALWIMLAALLVAIGAPAAMADSNTYAFVGAGYFAGTDVSITTNGPAILGTLYSSNPAPPIYSSTELTRARSLVSNGSRAHSFWNAHSRDVSLHGTRGGRCKKTSEPRINAV
jgi:hypothetical protein